MKRKGTDLSSSTKVSPTGMLKELSITQIKPSVNNPRQLFDRKPLDELKKKH
ncbi:MAG: hypothetical protein WEA61_10955 [Anaerolineales bacterium]